MRLFYAALLPERVQEGLSRLRERVGDVPRDIGWTVPRNIHITLKFLGDVPDEQVAALASGLRIGAAGPIALKASHLVVFPPKGPARVLAAGFSGDVSRLLQLQEAVERHCADAGFAPEPRRYTPHATLARCRAGLPRQMLKPIERGTGGFADVPAFELTAIQLMASELSPGGSRYTVVAQYAV